MLFVSFFFKSTAPTVFSTYLHTLALLDALPFCLFVLVARQRLFDLADMHLDIGRPHPRDRIGQLLRRSLAERGDRQRRLAVPERVEDRAGLHDLRSEEHTSELQSLMPISYYVF